MAKKKEPNNKKSELSYNPAYSSVHIKPVETTSYLII